MNGNDKDALRSSPSAALGIGEALINRKRLLVSLLSDREAVRVICAPPLYGKTVLANQYARMAFPPGNVTWVQASEPEFLVTLIREVSKRYWTLMIPRLENWWFSTAFQSSRAKGVQAW